MVDSRLTQTPHPSRQFCLASPIYTRVSLQLADAKIGDHIPEQHWSNEYGSSRAFNMPVRTV